MHQYLQKLKTNKHLSFFKHLIDFNFITENNISYMIEIFLEITRCYLEKNEDTEYHLFYLMLVPILLDDIHTELKSMGKTGDTIETIKTTMECCDYLHADRTLNIDELIKDKRKQIYNLVFT